MSCSNCSKSKYCNQCYSIERTLNAEGRPYDVTSSGCWLYDYKATAYNHRTRKSEEFSGRIQVKPETLFAKAIAANIRKQDEDAWFCTSAPRI